ncbi:MAG: hypothetical protein AAF492_06300, partial [Verrucomicrobiota bacterium]
MRRILLLLGSVLAVVGLVYMAGRPRTTPSGTETNDASKQAVIESAGREHSEKSRRGAFPPATIDGPEDRGQDLVAQSPDSLVGGRQAEPEQIGKTQPAKHIENAADDGKPETVARISEKKEPVIIT